MTTYITDPTPTPSPWWRLKRFWAAVVLVATVAGIALGGLSLPDLSAISDFASEITEQIAE